MVSGTASVGHWTEQRRRHSDGPRGGHQLTDGQQGRRNTVEWSAGRRPWDIGLSRDGDTVTGQEAGISLQTDSRDGGRRNTVEWSAGRRPWDIGLSRDGDTVTGQEAGIS